MATQRSGAFGRTTARRSRVGRRAPSDGGTAIRALARASAFVTLLVAVVGAPAIAPHAEIRFWVDEDGVTHFSNEPSAGPEGATDVDAHGLEPIRAAWDDGITGPPIAASGRDSSSDDARVRRLLRGALSDLERGEGGRADAALRGVLRLDPDNARAHWQLAVLARSRGRFDAAERHLHRFLESAGPEYRPWRDLARRRLASIADERRLADPKALDGPLRLEWVHDEHFRLQVDSRLGSVSRDYAARVLDFLRAARAEVSRSIGVEPLEPLGVVLYGRAAYVRAHAHRFSFQTIGFFDGRIHVASPAHPTETLRGILFHEYTHAVYRDVTGGDRPYWLNEGLAERIERLSRGLAVSTRSERAAMRANIETGTWIPLRSIDRSFAGLTDARARDAYLQSVETVAWIHERTDVAQRRRMLEAMGEGLSIDQALHEMLGLDTEGLESAVQADIRNEFPDWSLPSARVSRP